MTYPVWPDFYRIGLLALCYIGAAKFALMYSIAGENATRFWPPSGLALPALLIYGTRLWPGITAGAFVTAYSAHIGSWPALTIAVGNTLEPWIAASLLRMPAFGFQTSVRRLRDYMLLLGIGAVVGPMLSASLGSAAISFAGVVSWDRYASTWAIWWMGNALGVAVFAPFLLIFKDQPVRRSDFNLEGIMMFSLLMLCGRVVFGGWLQEPFRAYATAFVLFPFICWIAVRFTQRGVLLATLLVISQALWGATQGIGYFGDDIAATGLLNFWIFSAILTTTGVVLATVLNERRQAEEQLRLMSRALESTQEGVMITDLNGDILTVNPAFTAITGYDAGEVMGQNPRILKSGNHEPAFYETLFATLKRTGHWQGEILNRRKTGEIYPSWQTISTVIDADGRIKNYVGVFSDISMLKVSQQKLEHLAHHDPLTGLPNRLMFRDRLEHAMQRADRIGAELAVAFLDLDRFKQVNDSLGHTVGDALLQAVAERLQSLVRRDDTLARLGGDEFTILMEGLTDREGAVHLAEKLVQGLTRPFQVCGHELFLGASVGISLYPQDAQSGEALLRNADAAMYRAKDSGRNTYRFYSEDMTATALERIVLEWQLRRALNRGELCLHYQPQLDLGSGNITGVEALVYWSHPERGLLSPSTFIPLAEESGLIIPLGNWVLRTACIQGKTWLEAGIDFGCLAVNIAEPQIRQGSLTDSLRRILSETQLPPERLELELTENLIMGQPKQIVDQLLAVRELGVKLSIDDFGTGYSSLAYLKQLPIDKLKLDQGFVRDLPDDHNDVAIAKAVIALGHSLQFKVIAEGVETEAQRRFLQAEGCDQAQGYLYSRPVPPEALASFFAGLTSNPSGGG